MDLNNGVITDNGSLANFDAMRDDVHLMRRLGGDPKKAEERQLAELAVTNQRATQHDEILLQQTKDKLEVQRQGELRLRTVLNGNFYTGRALGILLFIASLITVVLALTMISMFNYFPSSKIFIGVGLLGFLFFGQRLAPAAHHGIVRKFFNQGLVPLLIGVSSFLLLPAQMGYLVYVISGLASVVCYHLLREIRTIINDTVPALRKFRTERALAGVQFTITNLESQLVEVSSKLRVAEQGNRVLRHYAQKLRECEQILTGPDSNNKNSVYKIRREAKNV